MSTVLWCSVVWHSLIEGCCPFCGWTFGLFRQGCSEPVRVCCLCRLGVGLLGAQGTNQDSPHVPVTTWLQTVTLELRCPPPSQHRLLLLVTSLSRMGEYFYSTFVPLKCCGVSTQITQGAELQLRSDEGGRPSGTSSRVWP